MSNSLVTLQSEHTELLKCVRTTSTVLSGVLHALDMLPPDESRALALAKLKPICHSLDALVGLASVTPLPALGEGDMEYEDEVDMDRALEGYSHGLAGLGARGNGIGDDGASQSSCSSRGGAACWQGARQAVLRVLA